MNPFDLAGPPFLVFYVLLIAVVAAALHTAIGATEDGAAPVLPLGDPYQIAWLRGGDKEAVRVAVLSLLDRDLVELGESAVTARVTDVTAVEEPIERAILSRCIAGGELLGRLADDPVVASVCDRLRVSLTRVGLVPNGAQRRVRIWIFGLAVAVLAIVALVKLAVAFERGRGNVSFLIALALIAPFALGALVLRRRTRLGDRMLSDLRRLLAGLRERADAIRRGEATSDAILLAAVFGLAILPDGQYFDLRRAYRKADQSRGGSCGGCGGGGGGGGGCGGGCGGCGGG